MNINHQLFNKLRKQKILPIIHSINFKKDFLSLTSLLNMNKEFKVIEITIREKESIKNAIKLKESFPNLTFGIGSILNRKQYKEIQSYNFDFFVSPCIIYEIINSKVLNYIPGAETINDFNYLYNNKINIIKFFPASINNAHLKIKSIENIYKNLFFLPTGGITNENINQYLQLNNVLCVGMSNINEILKFLQKN